MRRARWLAEWRHSLEKPVFYHCISRVVDRRFVLAADEKEKFRALMRVYERFSGCRVVAYCLMDNHFHLLLEVPPMADAGISDQELLTRLSALYAPAYVAQVAHELADKRKKIAAGQGSEELIQQLHNRFTYRMHNLGEFMKGLLQRYTQWHNRRHARTGRLWEDRFKSVIVEDGAAARTISAYIDLNPVRAGMVQDPAEYRWCSYGEAIGGGSSILGRTARAGLVRAWCAHQGISAEAHLWDKEVGNAYRMLLMEAGLEKSEDVVTQTGEVAKKVLQKGTRAGIETFPTQNTSEIPFATVLRCRVRYFTDGAVIGSRSFVDDACASSRWRFGPQRKSGARKMKGNASALAGTIWSLRDLRKENG